MRWLFLLLVVLNVFYYVWHQQEAPLRVKEVAPLALYKGSQQEIRCPASGWSAPGCRGAMAQGCPGKRAFAGPSCALDSFQGFQRLKTQNYFVRGYCNC